MPLRLVLQPNEPCAEGDGVATVLLASASLEDLVALARHAFGSPAGIRVADDASAARLYLSDGSSVQMEDLYDDDEVVVAFEGEPFYGAVAGSAWSLASVLNRSGKQTAGVQPVAAKRASSEGGAPLMGGAPAALGLLADPNVIQGQPPISGEADSDALLDASVPRSRSVGAPVAAFYQSLPFELKKRAAGLFVACVATWALAFILLWAAMCGGAPAVEDTNSTAPLPGDGGDSCWAGNSPFQAAARCLAYGTVPGALLVVEMLRRAGRLPKLPPVVDGRFYGVLLFDWKRILLCVPLCTALGALLGLLATYTPADPAVLHATLVDGRGEPLPGQLEPAARGAGGWTEASEAVGLTWGLCLGLLAGLGLGFVLLWEALELKTEALGLSGDGRYAGALERTKLRRRIRATLSVFEGRNGITLINTLAFSALSLVVLYFVSNAATASLSSWRPAALPLCAFAVGAPGVKVPHHCRPLPPRCEEPPLWMRPTLLKVMREAAALQPLPSPASERVYVTPIGAGGGELGLSRGRLLSHSEGEVELRVCWREESPQLQMMPDLLSVRFRGWETEAEADVAVQRSGGGLPFFGRRLQASAEEAPDASKARLDYSAFGSLSLLLALDVADDGDPEPGAPPLLPGTAHNGTGTEACDGHFECSRAVALGALRSLELGDADLADAVDAAAVAAAARLAALLCFGREANTSDTGAVGHAGDAGGDARRLLLAQAGREEWGLAYDLPRVLGEALPALKEDAARQVGLVWAVSTAGLLVFGLALSVILCMRCCGNVAAGAHAIGCCCVKVEGSFDGKANGCCCVSFFPPRSRVVEVQRPYDRFFGLAVIDGTAEPMGAEQKAFWEAEQQADGGPLLSAAKAQLRGACKFLATPFEAARNLVQNAARSLL